MNDTDRELLELAARAIDGKIDWYCRGANNPKGVPNVPFLNGYDEWNPLTNDGDALRLAVKLKLTVNVNEEDSSAFFILEKIPMNCIERNNSDPGAATRRAIVRAAAEIGRTK